MLIEVGISGLHLNLCKIFLHCSCCSPLRLNSTGTYLFSPNLVILSISNERQRCGIPLHTVWGHGRSASRSERFQTCSSLRPIPQIGIPHLKWAGRNYQVLMLEKYFLFDGSWNLDDPRIRKVQGSTCLAPLMYSSYRMMDGVVFRSPSWFLTSPGITLLMPWINTTYFCSLFYSTKYGLLSRSSESCMCWCIPNAFTGIAY